MAAIKKLGLRLLDIKNNRFVEVLQVGTDARGNIAYKGTPPKKDKPIPFKGLQFYDGRDDRLRAEIRAIDGEFDLDEASEDLQAVFRLPYPAAVFRDIRPQLALSDFYCRHCFHFSTKGLFADNDTLEVRYQVEYASWLSGGDSPPTNNATYHNGNGKLKLFSLKDFTDSAGTRKFELDIFGTNANCKLRDEIYPALSRALRRPSQVAFKDRVEIPKPEEPGGEYTFDKPRAVGLIPRAIRRAAGDDTPEKFALAAITGAGPTDADAKIDLKLDQNNELEAIPLERDVDAELIQDIHNDAFLAPAPGQAAVEKAFYWYLRLKPLPVAAFVALWNDRIAKPYLDALRATDDARDLSFVPFLREPQPGQNDSGFEFLFDVVQTLHDNLQNPSLISDPVIIGFRPAGKTDAVFTADAIFPGLLTHTGQPVRRRVKVTVERMTLDQTFEWFDAPRPPAGTQPHITVKIADDGMTGAGDWVRVGALDLRVPDSANAKAAEVAAEIDIAFDVTFDPADPTQKTYASAASDPKGIAGRARLPRYGEAIPRIATRINRFDLSNVRPGSQDPVPDGARAFDAVLTDLIRAGNDPRASDANKKRIAREERIQRDLTRNAPVVFVDGKPETTIFFLRGEEITKADRNRRLSLTLHRTEAKDEKAYRTIVIDPEPLTVALVSVPSFLGGEEIAETDGEIANWETSELEGTRWEIARITDGFDLFFPPQATGEAAEKGPPWPPISTDDNSKTIDYRLGTAARLKLSSSYFKQRYAEAPWNLRRVLGYAGQRAPGAGLATARFEFLYGLGARFTAPRLRLAELGSRIGAIRDPLPARPSSILRRVGNVSGTEQRDVEAELYDCFRDVSASFTKGFGTRIAQFEAYREGHDDPLSLEERVAFELRIAAEEKDVKEDEDADVVLRPYSPAPGPGLQGGATWGFESKNIYQEVIGNGRPKSTRGQVLNPAFSALGGSGFMRAFFASGKSRIVADTAFGRTHVYAVERIGRVGVFWNIAKHVIVYERTVLRSDQFTGAQPRHAGRPILRKVKEYVELIELDRHFPEKGAALKSRGFVEACLFRTQRIPVDGSWGYDVPQGWVIPLWKPDADPDLYPKPDIRLQLSAAQSDAASAFAARFRDPSQLVFFTSTRREDGDDPNIWPARADIDFVNVPRPVPVGIPTIDPSDPDGRAADDLMRDPSVGRCTFDIDPAGEAANLVTARTPAEPIGAVLETVTMMRAAPTGTDGGPAGQALALRQELERIVADSRRWETLLQEALKTARDTLGRLLTLTRDSEETRQIILREAGKIRGLKDGVRREAAKARATIDEAVKRAKANFDGAKSGWTEDSKAFRERLREELRRNLTGRVKDVVAALSDLEQRIDDLARDVTDPKLAMAVARRIEDALEPVRQLVRRGPGRIGEEIDQFERAVAVARDEMTALLQTVEKTAGEMKAAVATVATRQDLNRLLAPYEDFHARVLAQLDSVDRSVRRDLPKHLKTLTIFGGGQKITVIEFMGAARTALLEAHQKAIEKIAATAGDVADAKVAVENSIGDAARQAEAVRKAAQDLAAQAAELARPAKTKLAEFTDGVEAKLKKLAAEIGETCKQVVDGTIKVEDLAKEIRKRVDTARSAVAGLEAKVVDAVTIIDAAVGGLLDEIGGEIGAAEAELQNTIDRAADFANNGIAALEGALVAGIEAAAAGLENNADKVADAIEEARNKLEKAAAGVRDELRRRDLGVVSDAVRTLEEGYKRLSKAPTFQNPSDTLALVRAAGSAPLLPNLQFNRERIAYFFDDLRDAVKTSPVVALMNRLDDDLQALGIRLPTGELLDRLIPKDLDKIDFGKLFPDLGGLKLDGLFKNLKLPASLNEQVKLTHGFDKASLTGWAKAEAKSNFPKRAEVFAFGPLKLTVVDAAFNALADLAIGADGALRRSTKGQIVGDWELAFGGQALVTMEQTRISFEDGKGLDVDIDPSRIRFDRAIKFLSDLIKTFGEPDSGFFLEMLEESGMPAGVAARLDLPLPPLSFGAFSIWGLRFSSSFGLHLVKGTGAKRGEFAIATSLALGRKSEPFILRVWILVGGGWLETRAKYFPASGKLSTAVSIGITAGLGLDFAFGPCRGYVFVMFGAYGEFASEGGGATQFSLAVILLVRGGIVILGRFNIGLYLLLEIIYQQDGTVLGRGTIEVTLKICWCVKIKVRQAVTYRLAGSSRALAAKGSDRPAAPHYLDSFA